MPLPCTAEGGDGWPETSRICRPMLNGATQVLFEGIPTWPDAGRLWEITDKYGVTQLYTGESPHCCACQVQPSVECESCSVLDEPCWGTCPAQATMSGTLEVACRLQSPACRASQKVLLWPGAMGLRRCGLSVRSPHSHPQPAELWRRRCHPALPQVSAHPGHCWGAHQRRGLDLVP